MNKYIIFFLILFSASCAHNQKIIDNKHYVVIDVTTDKIKEYDDWLKLEEPILMRFGANVVMDIRSSDQKQRHIIIAFPSREVATEFVKSPEFQKILPLNKRIAKTKVFHGELF